MKIIGRDLGIGKKITNYVARHTYATILLRKGISVEELSENLGHTSITATQHYVGGFDLEKKRQTASLLRPLRKKVSV